MKRSLSLSQVDVATPCHEKWEEMSGDERCRACAVCQNNVYNISAMTEEDALRLIEEKIGEGNLCIKLHRRADGTIMTQDCPVGMRERARILTLRLAAGIAALIAVLLFSWNSSKKSDPAVTDSRTFDLEVADPGPPTEPVDAPTSEEAEGRGEMMGYFGMICITRD